MRRCLPATFTLLLGLSIALLPVDARAVGACSPAIGDVVLNEYNHQGGFVEVSLLAPGVSLAGWEIRVYTSTTAFSTRALPGTGACAQAQYQTVTYGGGETPINADIVLLDANDDIVDIVRARGTLPVATAFHPRPACAYVGTGTDVQVDAARKGVDRMPDSFGTWRNTPGVGANSVESRCDPNTPTGSPANLALSKTVLPANVLPGETFSYALTVSNGGPNAASVTALRDVWPDGLDYISHAATVGNYDPVNHVWTLGTLANGATATLTVSASATGAGTFTNSAAVASGSTDPAPANNLASATVTVGTPVDHYAIGYPEGAAGLTCQPLAVRVTAHDLGDSVATPAAGTTITLSTAPAATGWALKAGGGALLAGPPRYVFSGAESFVELWLAQTSPATMDIDVVDGSGRRDRDGDAVEDAPAVFRDSGLVFDVPDHAAGVAQTVAVRALRKDDATQACVPAFANVTRSVRFWSGYANPATGTLPVAVNGSAIAGAAPGTAFDLAFDAGGSAAVDVLYPDVGAMGFFASLAFTGVDGVARTLLGDDAFVVRPFGFKLAGLACAAPFSPAAGAFCPAGETVSGTLSAVRYDASQPQTLGAATPNFGQESPAQGATLALDTLVVPAAGGVATPLAAQSVGAFAGGAAAISFNWPQVGSFTVRPVLGGASYLGSGDLPPAGSDASRSFAGTIGRFHPYRFVVTDAGSAPGHPGCALTYAGQPFPLAFSLQAVAKDLATATANYGVGGAGGYAPRVTGAALSLVAENADDGVDRAAQIVTSPGGAPPAFTPAWAGAAAGFAGAYAFRRGSAIAPYGPWDTLRIGVRLADDSGDAVPLVGDMNAATSGACAPCDARALVDGALRHGRLRMSNAFGSELIQLPLPLVAESWTGSGWAQNTLDSCTALATPLPAGAFTGYRGGLAAGETAGTLASPLAAGSARLRLSAPGAGNAGAVRITIAAPDWLRFRWDDTDQGGDGELFDDDPSAVASFGVSRNNFIFMRENY